jgi:hypothetical protein
VKEDALTWMTDRFRLRRMNVLWTFKGRNREAGGLLLLISAMEKSAEAIVVEPNHSVWIDRVVNP